MARAECKRSEKVIIISRQNSCHLARTTRLLQQQQRQLQQCLSNCLLLVQHRQLQQLLPLQMQQNLHTMSNRLSLHPMLVRLSAPLPTAGSLPVARSCGNSCCSNCNKQLASLGFMFTSVPPRPSSPLTSSALPRIKNHR